MPQTVAPVVDIEARGYAHPEVLVSTQWVADHLADPNVRIVESDEDILLERKVKSSFAPWARFGSEKS